MSTKKARAVLWLAPVAPPCFTSRGQWIGYLQSAAEATRDEHEPGPLLYAAGHPIAFNHEFSFCEDCSEDYASAARRYGECQPDHLKRINPALQREEEVA